MNATSSASFRGIDPATGKPLDAEHPVHGPGDVERACTLAATAFRTYRETSPAQRAAFLEAIAERILRTGDRLLDIACAESGLPAARILGERGRTVGQLRLFAEVVRAGDWVDVRIDPALPDRQPAPRSDLRLRKVGIGPVAVFGASNFPLAFSTAGGDTASALAAGCPVVLKAHPAHPGTSALVAAAIADAVAACGLPEGVFQHLSGPGNALGSALVRDPRIKAVAFTGSRAGGLALVALAAARPEPIPVYAEMSSVNPVFLLPGALTAKAEALGEAFIGSLTLGAGQFCTNPGLVFAVAGEALARFEAAAAASLARTRAATMLTSGIHAAYERGIERLAVHGEVQQLARGCASDGENQGRGALFAVDAATFRADPALREEVFGAASIIVRCADLETLMALAGEIEGQLTGTMHLDRDDHETARRLLGLLEDRCGRVLVNGWPTGVEVCHAMVHGGPFPATSDVRSTSVGSLAIERFLRPVCYQDVPDDLLPPALRRSNPLQLPRREG
ncbi:MAG TPA: aldehyde dehydrogenase (NADP(+)) [Dyella sp.]|uniref:aldehyde dehydrogenase (NADP(+)) n=1 Tax=Dyella sp. TaxID=1869338 RepID=UPI002F9592DB